MSKAANKAATARIIALMKEQGVSKPFWNSYVFGVRVELNELPRKLQKGERLFTVIPCKYKGRRGIVAVTSLRVIVLNAGYFGIFSNKAVSTVSLEPNSPSALANASACCCTVSGCRLGTRVTVK